MQTKNCQISELYLRSHSTWDPGKRYKALPRQIKTIPSPKNISFFLQSKTHKRKGDAFFLISCQPAAPQP